MIRDLWNQYKGTGGSQVIWAARLHAAGAALFALVDVAILVLHNNIGFVSAFTSDPVLVAYANIGIGIAYEVLRRYKADDL